MHLWRLCLVLGLFEAFTANGAVVYKWTDADDVVHYSDQPVPGAEKIVTSAASSNGIGGSPRSPSNANAAGKNPPPAATSISELAIDSPVPEQVFFGDDTVSVHLHLVPGLQPSQTITWHLNGQPLNDQAPDAVSITLQTLPRGSYSISATVTDSNSGESRSSGSVMFHVNQPSELSPQHRKP